ncbi:MAG: hypothetical protein JSS02_06070, partial [Planctomycetes bacterium]|nr:hypothetical protein [Planctomycetota bacterium]
MSDFATKYDIPTELDQYIDSGFLELLSESEAEKTLTFAIPSLEWVDERDRDVMFTLVWIHPEFNAEFCHYFEETPGDLANFYLFKETTDSGDECLDLETLDDLLVWLNDRQETRSR